MSSTLMEKVDKFVMTFPITWTLDGCNKPSFTTPTETLPPLVVREESLNDKFFEASRSVIAEAGTGYVYKPEHCTCGCGHGQHLYVSGGEGACLIGRILVRMGVNASTLHQYEGLGADQVVMSLFGGNPDAQSVAYTARCMQGVNDSGQPWGLALDVLNRAALLV